MFEFVENFMMILICIGCASIILIPIFFLVSQGIGSIIESMYDREREAIKEYKKLLKDSNI